MFSKLRKYDLVCINVPFLPFLLLVWVNNQDFIGCFILYLFSGLNVEIVMVFFVFLQVGLTLFVPFTYLRWNLLMCQLWSR